jgi:murein DD-endopeptidase MepM/ murein hydrolase activator NlpD
MIRLITAALVLLLLAACSRAAADQPLATIPASPPSPVLPLSPSPVPSSTPSPTPTATATPTTTPSPTPTPTATAVPLTVIPLPITPISAPVAQGGAPCGIADTFDFPIDPPDAAHVSGSGQDFGVFRSRYDKFHAGEDWRGPDGQPSLGSPVYAIGHGRVMYAEPEGWNRDKGVVIVEHVLADGTIIYSFYGHLDPPSVVLPPGDCVVRGDQVGNIGQPRSSPHLHWEIRTHMPYQPGPGYWPEDPTTVGWLPPSATVWQQRLRVAPGVAWVRPSPNLAVQPITTLNDETVLLLEDGRVTAVSLTDGAPMPDTFGLDDVDRALADATLPILYTANRLGQLTATSLPEGEPLWSADLALAGLPRLLPLPGGGVIVSVRDELRAVAADGAPLWQVDVGERPFAWDISADQLLLTTQGSTPTTWLVQGQAPPQKLADLGGHPAVANGRLWLYGAAGLYELALDAAPALRLPLATSFLEMGDLLSQPDGGLLLLHRDLFDGRLLALNGEGAVRWDRSVLGQWRGQPRLVLADERPYLAIWPPSGSVLDVNLYGLDSETAVLTHLFHGGSRNGSPTDTWLHPIPNGDLLIHIGGGHLLRFTP